MSHTETHGEKPKKQGKKKKRPGHGVTGKDLQKGVWARPHGGPDPAQPKAVTVREAHHVGEKVLLDVIVFGRWKTFSVDEWMEQSPRIVRLHHEERFLLKNELETFGAELAHLEMPLWLETIATVTDIPHALGDWYRAFVAPATPDKDVRFYAPSVAQAEAMKKAWKETVVPSSKELRKRIKALEKELEDIPIPSQGALFSAPELFDVGRDLQGVRRKLGEISHDFQALHSATLRRAEFAEESCQLVADTSFAALHVLASISAVGNPVTELAYRLGIIYLEAGSYLVGQAVAGGVSGAWETAYPHIAAVLYNRVPGLVADMFLKRLGPSLGTGKARAALEAVVRFDIEFVLDLVRLYLQTDFSPSDEQLDQLFASTLVKPIFILIGLLTPIKPDSPKGKQLALLVARALVDTVGDEWQRIKKIAETDHVAIHEAIFSQIPSILARVIVNLLMGVLGQVQPGAAKESKKPWNRLAARIDQGAKRSRMAANITFSWTGRGWRNPTRKVPLLSSKEIHETGVDQSFHRVEVEKMRAISVATDTFNVVRVTAVKSFRFFGSHLFWPKPEAVKAKTAKTGPHEGKVAAEPSETVGARVEALRKVQGEVREEAIDALTPDWIVKKGSLSDAEHATKVKQYAGMMQGGGFLVRPDGLVFHPKQVADWARQFGKGDATKLVEALAAVNAAGHLELDKPSARRALDRELSKHPPAVRELWDAAKSGQYGLRGDHDMAESIRSDGKRVQLGEGSTQVGVGEASASASSAKVGEANRKKLTAMFELHKTSAEERDRMSPFQHGEHLSALRLSNGKLVPLYGRMGDLAVFDPHGNVKRINESDAIALAKQRLGRKPTDDEIVLAHVELMEAHIQANMNAPLPKLVQRQDAALKDAVPLTVTGVDPPGGGPPPRKLTGRGSPVIRKTKTEKIPRVVDEPVDDPIPSGKDVSMFDLQASTAVRGLILVCPASAEMLDNLVGAATMRRFEEVGRRFETVLAIDPDGKHLVVATHGNDSAAEGLRRLVSVATELDLKSRRETLHFEVYASVELVTRDRIAGYLPSGHLSVYAFGDANTSNILAGADRKWELKRLRAFHRMAGYGGLMKVTYPDALDSVWTVPGPLLRLGVEGVKLLGQPVALYREPLVRVSLVEDGVRTILGHASTLRERLAKGRACADALVTLGALAPASAGDPIACADALRAFQSYHMLKADAVVGSDTRRALSEALGEDVDDFVTDGGAE